jgi:hypothetical protein
MILFNRRQPITIVLSLCADKGPACGNCDGCPLREQCTASQKNREMGVSKKLLAFREASRANITSEEGIVLRVNRSIQVEGAFGVTKEGSRFRRFMTRGKAGVRGE